MSDYGDFCRDIREHRRIKKDHYRYGGGMQDEIKLAEKISEDIVQFSEEHYRLSIKTDRGIRSVDFWPSTKKWKIINSKANGYGINRLKSYLKLNDK